jgi:hypothetical protein
MFALDGVYYTVNPNYNNLNQVSPTNDIYNLCNCIELYCNATYTVVNGSLITPDCKGYRQSSIQLINASNVSSGIMIEYQDPSNTSATRSLLFPCNGSGLGCP